MSDTAKKKDYKDELNIVPVFKEHGLVWKWSCMGTMEELE